MNALRQKVVTEIMALLRPEPTPLPKPTIAELEKILNSETTDVVSINPDGSIGVQPTTTTVGAVADAILAILPAWQSIETAPLGDDDFYLVCCNDPADDRSPFVVRGSIFASARKRAPMHHLSLAYLTHWMPLPEKPAAPTSTQQRDAP